MTTDIMPFDFRGQTVRTLTDEQGEPWFVAKDVCDILGITNRIGVMSNGHLSGIVNTKETDQEELLRLSAKYL